MKKDIVKYETGATSHAVNDLILFTDNTGELAQQRDSIYQKLWNNGYREYKFVDESYFAPLFNAAKTAYIKTFPSAEDHGHIYSISQTEKVQYCRLYAYDFDNWKFENGHK